MVQISPVGSFVSLVCCLLGLATTDLLSKRQCGKVYYSYRSVSIGQDAVEILREQQGKTGSEYVFPSSAGGPISPDSVLKMLHRVLKRAGLPEIRFHDLRHPYVKPMTKNSLQKQKSQTISENDNLGLLFLYNQVA